MRFLSRFVDSNERELRRIQPLIDEANELESEIAALSDEEIRERFAQIRDEIREVAAPGEPSEEELTHPDLERRRELAKDRHKRELGAIEAALEDVIPDVFAMGREAMRRTLDMRHFDVQLMGGIVLHQGKIAEMKTGEGTSRRCRSDGSGRRPGPPPPGSASAGRCRSRPRGRRGGARR